MDYISLWKDYQDLVAQGDVLVDRDRLVAMPCGFRNDAYRSLASAHPDRYAVVNDLDRDAGYRLWRATRVYATIRVYEDLRGRRLTIPELQKLYPGMPKTTAWRYLTNQIN